MRNIGEKLVVFDDEVTEDLNSMEVLYIDSETLKKLLNYSRHGLCTRKNEKFSNEVDEFF